MRWLTVLFVGVLMVLWGWLALQKRSVPRAEFTYAIGDSIRTLDPARMAWNEDIRLALSVWEGLASYDPQTTEPIAAVAYLPPEMSEDGTVYTFELRREARWSNGDAVTADDFVYAWRRAIEPGSADDIKLNRIYFDYDKYNLDNDAITILAENAAALMDNPSVKIRVEGHCDDRGTEDYNLALGEKRALAARDYLVNFGIAQSRISVISYGEERPLDPAETEKAWAKNRRSEFDIR